MSDPAIYIPVVLLVAVVVATSTAWESARSRTLLNRWAARRGLRIVRSERRVLRTGPYFFRATDAQVVYFITVVNAATGGNRRDAYVRVGGWLLGLFADRVDVRWA